MAFNRLAPLGASERPARSRKASMQSTPPVRHGDDPCAFSYHWSWPLDGARLNNIFLSSPEEISILSARWRLIRVFTASRRRATAKRPLRRRPRPRPGNGAWKLCRRAIAADREETFSKWRSKMTEPEAGGDRRRARGDRTRCRRASRSARRMGSRVRLAA